uniref:Lactamase_B domain-containing protein n=1 Tax=Caenorhabditis tropicalis TaxID=1561998 RepID=A0A1I7UDF1_9PELO
MKSVLSSKSGGEADKYVSDGEVIDVGGLKLEVRETPGHTDGCVSYVEHTLKSVFTGDALLIRKCGRTDFQQGNSSTLYDSVHKKIFTLPEDYVIYVGHDYDGVLQTSVWEEKNLNPRLTKSKEEFVEFMKNMKLDYPKQIDKAVPANMKDGKEYSI